ncbi:MAG: MarR family winged helix-turn-helix transcriptional regulator [Candidatus Velthaea sp.]
MSAAALSDHELERYRARNLRRLLASASRALNKRVTAELQKRGHARVRLAHSALLASLDLDGSNVTEVADRAQISKQAMGKLAIDLEALGYIQRRPDPNDRRAWLLCFTGDGRRLVRDSVDIVEGIERSSEALLGTRAYGVLRRGLSVLVDDAPPS